MSVDALRFVMPFDRGTPDNERHDLFFIEKRLLGSLSRFRLCGLFSLLRLLCRL